MEIPTDSIEAAQAYISEHFYLCHSERDAIVYILINNTFKDATVQACKDLYLRDTLFVSSPMGGLLWSPQKWFFETAPVHCVTNDHTKPRTFISDGWLTLNIYIRPIYPAFKSFPVREQCRTLTELVELGTRRLLYQKNVRYGIQTVMSGVKYPLCMKSALAEDIHPSDRTMLMVYIITNHPALINISLKQLNCAARTNATQEEMAFIPHKMEPPNQRPASKLPSNQSFDSSKFKWAPDYIATTDSLFGKISRLRQDPALDMVFNCDEDELRRIIADYKV